MHMESGVRELMSASWGLVPWWSKTRNDARRPINARSETIKRSPVFREAFERRRCVVVADGFYEWTPPPEGMKAPKQPLWFRPANGGLLLMAGLWESLPSMLSGTMERPRQRRTLTLVHHRHAANAKIRRAPPRTRPLQTGTMVPAGSPNRLRSRPAPRRDPSRSHRSRECSSGSCMLRQHRSRASPSSGRLALLRNQPTGRSRIARRAGT